MRVARSRQLVCPPIARRLFPRIIPADHYTSTALAHHISLHCTVSWPLDYSYYFYSLTSTRHSSCPSLCTNTFHPPTHPPLFYIHRYPHRTLLSTGVSLTSHTLSERHFHSVISLTFAGFDHFWDLSDDLT